MKVRKILIALAVLAVASSTEALAGGTDRQIVVPPRWQGAYDFGYAPAVRVGDWVIISGIPAGGEGSYEDKIRHMYQRAVELLEASGATIEDVVELTSYHLESTGAQQFRAEFERYMPVHREFFGEHRPAWTAVGTTALLSPSAVVEMRLVAVAGSGRNSRVVSKVTAAAAAAGPPSEP